MIIVSKSEPIFDECIEIIAMLRVFNEGMLSDYITDRAEALEIISELEGEMNDPTLSMEEREAAIDDLQEAYFILSRIDAGVESVQRAIGRLQKLSVQCDTLDV